MANTNEVATSFEVVKHQGYWFIVSKDHKYIYRYGYIHKQLAEYDLFIGLAEINYITRSRWMIFHPRNHYAINHDGFIAHLNTVHYD